MTHSVIRFAQGHKLRNDGISLKPSYFDSKIYVLSTLVRLSFFPWKHLY